MKWAKQKQGFTIVELLIVVVVIAILAAITIVAFNGIANRAKLSAIQATVEQTSKKIQVFAIQNADAYPDDLAAINISDKGGTTYQYSVDNNVSPRIYCLTVTTDSISYYQNSSTVSKPTAGACPSHGLNGIGPNLALNSSFETDTSALTTRTNLITNPGFETATTGWGNVNGGVGAAVSISPTQVQSGTRSLQYTYGDSTTQDSGPSSSLNVTAGVTYTLSAWVYAPVSIGGGLRLIAYGTALGNTERGAVNTTTGSWVRLTQVITPTVTGALSFAVGKNLSATETGKLLYVDSVFMEASTGTSNYFSGASAASGDFTYAWSGTANASTSLERALNVLNYTQNGSGGVRFQSQDRAVTGSSSARILITSNSTNAGLYQGIVLQPGTYTFMAKVWLESGVTSNTGLTAQGTGVTVNNLSSYPGSTTTQGQWVDVRRSITVSTAGTVNFFVYIMGASTAVGKSFWVDDFAVLLNECTTTVCY